MYYLEVHNSTKHDGSIALESDRGLTIYTSERIDRKKHSNNFNELKKFFIKRTNKQFKIPTEKLIYKPFQHPHHHLVHAACSFFSSPFEKASILIIDGMGPYNNNNYASTSLWEGKGNKINLISINPEKGFSYNSLGHFYSAVTYYCGFNFWQEGKTMGLAPFGSNGHVSKNLNKMFRLIPNGDYEINRDFIGYCFSLRYRDEILFKKYYQKRDSFTKYYERLFGAVRSEQEDIEINHKDLAWAGQNILEKTVLHIIKHFKKVSNHRNLCLGGGTALNSVINGLVLNKGIYDNVYIPPICGDDGQALGKLFYRKYVVDNKHRDWYMHHAYLGSEYEQKEIIQALKKYDKKINYTRLCRNSILKHTAKFITKGNIIGWFQGKSEVGPRALGHRSILADPRKKEMKNIINSRIKHREMFRPFAPSILNEYLNDYFYSTVPSPFMLFVFKAKPQAQKLIPAVVHVDGTSRVQTVCKKDNGIYYDLIREFYKLTKVPVLLNTSFNDNGEPIVETPYDAIKAFLNLDLDALVIDNYFVLKSSRK